MLSFLRAEETAKEVWQNVKVPQITCVRASLPDILDELNRMVRDAQGGEDAPLAVYNPQDPKPAALPKGIREDEVKTVRKWVDDFSPQKQAHWKPAPVTLELRGVSAYEVLLIVAEISDLSLLETDTGFQVTRELVNWEMTLIPTPYSLKPLANEILEEGLAEDLWGFFTGGGSERYLLRPLNQEFLLFFGSKQGAVLVKEYAQRFPAKAKMSPEDLDVAFLSQEPDLHLPSPKQVHELTQFVARIPWEKEWEQTQSREKTLPVDPEAGSATSPPSVPPGLVIQRDYDVLTIEMTEADRFRIQYVYHQHPGKYFSPQIEIKGMDLRLSPQEMVETVRLFVLQDRKSLRLHLQQLREGGPVEEGVGTRKIVPFRKTRVPKPFRYSPPSFRSLSLDPGEP